MKMATIAMVIILALVLLLSLAGCSKPPDQWEPKPTVALKNIKGLEDCTYTTTWTGVVWLHIIRCPNSTVNTTTNAKSPVRTITVDGVEYVEKQ